VDIRTQQESRRPELIDYGRYARQLQPYLHAYGFENVLPVFFPRLVTHSQAAFERIGGFLGHRTALEWDTTMKPQSAGRDRLRRSPIREALVQAPVLSHIRRRIVPQRWSQALKKRWRAHVEPPRMPPHVVGRLREISDADLAQLGAGLRINLDCENFHEMTMVERNWDAANPAREVTGCSPRSAAATRRP
jgi:hypothetical protein